MPSIMLRPQGPMEAPGAAAARLRGLDNPLVNADQLGAILSGLRGGNQTTGDMLTSDALTSRVEDAAGDTPALQGLRRALDAERYGDVTRQLGAEDDLASGRPQRIGLMQAGMQNQVGDVLGEGAARRQMLPFASDLHDRQVGDVNQRAQIQYGYPAQIRAASDLAVADRTAQGRVQAEQERSRGGAEANFAALLQKLIRPGSQHWYGDTPDSVPGDDAVTALRKLLSLGPIPK